MPMIGKLIVYGSNRDSCIHRLKRALEEFVVEGMKTTIPLHQKLVRDPEFLAGEYTIKWLEASTDRSRRRCGGGGADTSDCATNNPDPDNNGPGSSAPEYRGLDGTCHS